MGDLTFSSLMNSKFMFHYAIPLLEKKSNYVILHVDTNAAPYKAGLDITNEILELMNFIKEKDPYCKKFPLSTPIIRTDNYNTNKENESFISGLKESNVSYITHNNSCIYAETTLKTFVKLKIY